MLSKAQILPWLSRPWQGEKVLKNYAALAGAIILSLGLAACGGHGMQSVPAANQAQSADSGVLHPLEVTGGIGPSQLLSALLGDAAPSFSGRTLSHFYIGVREVDMLLNGQVIPIAQSGSSPYTMDLLAYQNGSALKLLQSSISPAPYTGMRFVLAPSASSAVFADGTTMPVSFVMNNGSTSGPGSSTVTSQDASSADALDVTVNGSFALAPDAPASFNIDFNAFESMALSNNTLLVRPALVASIGAVQGSASGTILNQNGLPVQNAVVAAVAADGTIANTAVTGPHGLFNVHALNAGTYTLRVFNTYTTQSGQPYAASGQTSSAASFDGPTVNVGSGSSVAVGTIAD